MNRKRCKVTVLDTSSAARVVDCPTTLEGWQALVGGYIEEVRRGKNVVLVNEDGLSLGLAPNHAASLLVGLSLVGPVVVLDRESLAEWMRG